MFKIPSAFVNLRAKVTTQHDRAALTPAESAARANADAEAIERNRKFMRITGTIASGNFEYLEFVLDRDFEEFFKNHNLPNDSKDKLVQAAITNLHNNRAK